VTAPCTRIGKFTGSETALYCIVDIETTGGSPSRDKITEIAIVVFDGDKIIEQYESLVNPEQPIPPRIVRLNGLADADVATAPVFADIIDKVESLTEGHIFVAQNVNFDYAFLRREFNILNRKFQRKKLCTARLSRKLIPGLASYNLDTLCKKLNIINTNRHRAMGDAKATTEVFKHLLHNDPDDFVTYSLNRNSREAVLPPSLQAERFERLPAACGVYFFYDEKGKVIYVGKAKNIKSRVTNHFSYNTNTQSKQRFVHHIYDVDYELCGSEFFAYLTEVHAIKKHWPRFNGAMKRIRLNFGIFTYYDRNGYGRFAVAETSKTNRGILSFRHMSDAWFRIQDLMHEHGLCKRLSGLQETSGACHLHEHGECNGACIKNESATDYNERFAAALTELTTDDSTYIVKSEGRDAEEIGVVLVENGRYKGFGYAPINAALETINAVRQHLQYGYDDQDVQFIVQNHIWNHPTSKVLLVE
jgi:DNA polymerase-3 subunit epsilon